MKPPKPKLSKTLTKRTKLTTDQLTRARGQAGNGEASRYGTDGVQSLELTRRLAKAQRKAKRFVLYTDQLGQRLYIAKDVAAPLTFDKAAALTYVQGFDMPELKVEYWNQMFRGLLKFTTTHN